MASTSASTGKDRDLNLSVLSFNVWGLAFISKDRPTRIQAIGEYIANSKYDVVCLQELWINTDYETIRREVVDILPYSRFFHTGALGSGLAIFTRFPIIDGQSLPYSLSGTPLEVIAGDFFVNKAAGNVVILHPVLGEVEIWDTHMHAAGDIGKETRRAHRVTQAWELARHIRAGAERGRHIIVAGDFNSIPSSLPIAILHAHAELKDSWAELHPEAKTAAIPKSPEEGILLHGMTCDSALSTYSAGKIFTPETVKWQGKRLDYIFYRSPTIDSSSSLMCTSSKVTLTGLVPHQRFSYSDHFGLESIFSIRPLLDTSAPLIEVSSSPSCKSVEPESTTTTRTVDAVKLDTIKAALALLHEYFAEVRSSARIQLGIFYGSLAFGIALTVSSAWQPKSYIRPIWTLLGVATGAIGGTMLYTGFVWGRWESNLLKEFIEQLETEQAAIQRNWNRERHA